LCCEHVLEHDLVERQVCHQPFQLEVFILALLDLSDLLGFQSGIASLPPIEGRFSDPEMTDQVGDRSAPFCLFQYGYDLFHTEALSFHGVLLPLLAANSAGNSPSDWYENGGADQPGELGARQSKSPEDPPRRIEILDRYLDHVSELCRIPCHKCGQGKGTNLPFFAPQSPV
jgi:hypothetical protein